MATFVLAGGGTGGHVFPGLAVARELRARGHTVRFIGTERGMESKLVPAGRLPIGQDRDRRVEPSGLPQDASIAGRVAVEHLAVLAAAGTVETGGGVFDRRLRGWTGTDRGIMEDEFP